MKTFYFIDCDGAVNDAHAFESLAAIQMRVNNCNTLANMVTHSGRTYSVRQYTVPDRNTYMLEPTQHCEMTGAMRVYVDDNRVGTVMPDPLSKSRVWFAAIGMEKLDKPFSSLHEAASYVANAL